MKQETEELKLSEHTSDISEEEGVKLITKMNYASHSCSRCRRLKKKCSKELPICENCLKAKEPCDYPGRAPRRTRKEIEAAMMRGELENRDSCKRVKRETKVIDTADDSQIDKGQQSLVSAKSVTSFLNLLNTLNHTNANGLNVREERESTVEPSKVANVPDTGFIEHERHRSESTPVIASAIQIEGVLSVFKGARESPLKEPLDIPRPLYDRFIAAFFKHNHKSYPLMNKVDFLNKVSAISDFNNLSEQYDEMFIFQLYMIMAIGCTTLQRAGMLTSEQEALSEHFAYMAMRDFCRVMQKQNLETIKCLLLLGIYSFFEPKGVSSWTISGLIMRLCIGFGLNRALTTKKLKIMSVIEVEMRYRAFWAFYSFERLVSSSLGRISSISDDDINVPLPRPLFDEEKDDIQVTNMMINIRRLGGKIYRHVHSVSAGKKKLTLEEKQQVIDKLRAELDDVYNSEVMRISTIEEESNNITFHHSDIWLSMRYYQLQIMIYRPSSLVPKPPMNSLTILGDACISALKNTYDLYQQKLLPLNWITLFRVLTICNTMLYCLCQWSIDLVASKIEIQQCVEILQHFGSKWVFAAKCADVFSNIINTILEISLSNGRVPNMDKLTRELFGASNEYQDILDENNVDISWVDSIV